MSFGSGTMKFAERIRALYLACLSHLKDTFTIPRKDQPNNPFPRLPSYLEDVEIIQYAYMFYKSSKGLLVDHKLSTKELEANREFFRSLSRENAFKIVQVELNFIYDELYTKMALVYNGPFGYWWRFVCISLIVAAFPMFVSHHKPNVDPFDIFVSYALLVGAVVLEFIALGKLIFSNWAVALLAILKHGLGCPSIQSAIQRRTNLSKRTWSGNIYQYNLISYWVRKRDGFLEKIVELFGMKESLESILHRKKQQADGPLLDFIFNELKGKAINPARDEWTLGKDSIEGTVRYDESIYIWHIATEICYLDTLSTGGDARYKENREWCKKMSDYLAYLLVLQPKFMSGVSGTSLSRFQEDSEKIEKDIPDETQNLFQSTGLRATKDAYEVLNSMATRTKSHVEGRSKFLLSRTVNLAQDLKKKVSENPEETWKMMSKVWVELLFCGASHCRGDAHGQLLRQGRELISLVWLLTAHFGIGNQ